MPAGDGTGPQGRGPMTGRAAGFCAGFSGPGYANSDAVRGFGRGVGRGFGRGYWGRRMFWRGSHYPSNQGFFPTPTKDEEKNYLENMVKGLEAEIKDIRDRIKQLSEEK
jgi:hypothetical protein